MTCEECGATEATSVEVRYTDESSEFLELCRSCAREYEKGGFVAGIGGRTPAN